MQVAAMADEVCVMTRDYDCPEHCKLQFMSPYNYVMQVSGM